MPKFEFVSDARPSLFAYPPDLHPQHLQNGRPLLKRLLRFSRRLPRSEREKKKAAADVDAMDTVRVVAFTMKRPLADSCGTADEKGRMPTAF